MATVGRDPLDRRVTRRVGIIGYGLAGRVFHAPLVAAEPGLEVAAVVTGDRDRAARARADHPGADVVADLEALFGLADPVELVVVAAPNDAHVPLARRCVAEGVPVVVDKPLAATADEGRRLVGEAERAGVSLTVFQNRRWDGDFLTVRRLVGEGRLGRVHRFESRFERWRPAVREGSWREDPDPAVAGGQLFDLGSHLVDQAVVLFGPVEAVYAEVDRRRPGAEVDDDAFIALHHAGGVRSHLWMGALVARPGPRFRVLGDRAGYTRDGMDVQEAQLGAGLAPGSPGWGVGAAADDGLLGAGDEVAPVPTEAGAYERFYAAVATALDVGGPVPVDPWDAVGVLELLEAARRSAATGTVVRMGGGPVGA